LRVPCVLNGMGGLAGSKRRIAAVVGVYLDIFILLMT
jgi:hypothetical protein